MCWRSIKGGSNKIAEEDIPVFKVIYRLDSDNRLRAVYNSSFLYNTGVVYQEEPLKLIYYPYQGIYIVNEGFHSYSPECFIQTTCTLVLIKTDSYILDCIYRPYEGEVLKANCIIPKGSEYCLNGQGEYVSNSIKIINTETICVGSVQEQD